eukprot:539016-Pelagomonas_calceolata.AAC.1
MKLREECVLEGLTKGKRASSNAWKLRNMLGGPQCPHEVEGGVSEKVRVHPRAHDVEGGACLKVSEK